MFWRKKKAVKPEPPAVVGGNPEPPAAPAEPPADQPEGEPKFVPPQTLEEFTEQLNKVLAQYGLPPAKMMTPEEQASGTRRFYVMFNPRPPKLRKPPEGQ